MKTILDNVRTERRRQRHVTRRVVGACLGAMLAMAGAATMHASDPFRKPTQEELSMTSLPGYPGAPAVVLYREEISNDDIHSILHYERIKVLTEEGKKYANVELSFVNFTNEYDVSNSATVESIAGRTIHPDGTIIPFTGKPYLKTVVKENDAKLQERVFTLPDVEVGSIIEYRYAERSENFVSGPQWYLQGPLFVMAAHYQWLPTRREIVDGDGAPINAIAWYPILPPGAKFDHHETPAPSSSAGSGPQETYDLLVKDVPPITEEDHAPPLASFSYRLLFSFTPYRSGSEYWQAEGKSWSKHTDSFMNGGSALQDATGKTIAGATTDEDKLRKIYAAVMALENTHYTRGRGRREEKATGLGKVSNVGDVLSHGEGTPTQLTELFVAMARAAGLKAYVALVPDRAEHLFTRGWMNIDQLDDAIAVVTVDGRDRFFDPGERYCAFGHLAWEHTFVEGLRQTGNGTDFFQTPGDSQAVNHTSRVANLKLDEHGEVSGKIDITFFGAAALHWRQLALRGDDESTRHELRETLEHMAPKTIEVKVASIDDLTEYDKPLAVHYDVSGALGTPTGKRLLLPVDLFESHASASFPHDKRELPVYFHYPQALQDAVRINIDPGLAIEAVPDSTKASLPTRAAYNMTVQQGPTYFVARRNYTLGEIIIPTKDYGDLRAFYSQMEAKDGETVILKPAPATAATASAAQAPGN